MVSYIDKAIKTGRRVNMIYAAKSGVISKRVIQIYRYTDEEIVAYCFMRNQVRTFKQSNILAIEPTKYKLEAYA